MVGFHLGGAEGDTPPILYPHVRVKYLSNIPYLPVDTHSYVYAHGQYYLHTV